MTWDVSLSHGCRVYLGADGNLLKGAESRDPARSLLSVRVVDWMAIKVSEKQDAAATATHSWEKKSGADNERRLLRRELKWIGEWEIWEQYCRHNIVETIL